VALSAFARRTPVLLSASRRAASDRYLLLAGPTAANPQQLGQTDGHRTFTQTLRRILCGRGVRE